MRKRARRCKPREVTCSFSGSNDGYWVGRAVCTACRDDKSYRRTSSARQGACVILQILARATVPRSQIHFAIQSDKAGCVA